MEKKLLHLEVGDKVIFRYWQYNTSAGESFPLGTWAGICVVVGGQRESREKGGVTGVTEEAGIRRGGGEVLVTLVTGIRRGGGEGARRHWSPS